jgi:hypothetical protein
MALKTLRCCGDASSPEQRSALMAVYPLTPPKIITACLGGHRPSIKHVVAWLEAFIWGIRGSFLLAPAMVVTVVVCVL